MAIIDIGQGSDSLVLHPKAPKEMISVTPLEGGRRKVRINSSSIDMIKECLRKSKYSLYEGWRAQNENPATLFGSAIHSFLEVYYSGKPDERQMPKLETLEMMSYGHRQDGEETDLILRATRAFLTKAEPLSGLPEGDKRSTLNGVWLIHEYLKKFLDDPYTAHRDSSRVYTECGFTLPYITTPAFDIELFGTLDFIFKSTLTGELVPGDHKTTSSLSFGDSSYFDRERPNHQYTCYSLAAKKLFNVTTDDFLVNVFEVKARPKTARGSGPSFPRQLTKRSQEDFDELEEVIMDSVERYLYAIDHNRWPMGTVDSCSKYGGCQFRQVCASPKSIRETVLNGKFMKGSINETK